MADSHHGIESSGAEELEEFCFIGDWGEVMSMGEGLSVEGKTCREKSFDQGTKASLFV